MNWLTKSVLPKIKALVNKDEVKENLWIKCNSCNQMIFSKDLFENLNISSRGSFFCEYSITIIAFFERIKDLYNLNNIFSSDSNL